jgi:NAD(P)-dependent dehydrogenase (short-subunit alcohol dehydrogenase family)
LGDRPIDVLLNNAGIIGQRSGFGTLDYDAWAGAMNTNVFGPMRMAEAFGDNVMASDHKQMVFISSRMGSIAETSTNAYVYRSSKTALNMAVRCMSLELAGRGLTAVLFHPGHVSTDMGGASAPVTPPSSVAGMKQQILGFTQADNGRFLAFDGDEIPW